MGLLQFVKDAGSKLFGLGESNEEKAKKIVDHLNSFQLDTSNLLVSVNEDAVTLGGSVATIFDKIRVVATAGNVAGIASVNDDTLTVGEAVEVQLAPEQTFHTVVSGDTLSGIAKKFYDNANKYMAIFEANKPMLSHPDKIYPGQMLVIPAQEVVG
jgi:nucleoid-associated protein YgaU